MNNEIMYNPNETLNVLAKLRNIKESLNSTSKSLDGIAEEASDLGLAGLNTNTVKSNIDNICVEIQNLTGNIDIFINALNKLENITSDLIERMFSQIRIVDMGENLLAKFEKVFSDINRNKFWRDDIEYEFYGMDIKMDGMGNGDNPIHVVVMQPKGAGSDVPTVFSIDGVFYGDSLVQKISTTNYIKAVVEGTKNLCAETDLGTSIVSAIYNKDFGGQKPYIRVVQIPNVGGKPWSDRTPEQYAGLVNAVINNTDGYQTVKCDATGKHTLTHEESEKRGQILIDKSNLHLMTWSGRVLDGM